MKFFYNLLNLLQGTMNTPKPYGWFHLICIALTFLLIFILYKKKDNSNEKQLKMVLGIYGGVAFLLELIKQIIWTFDYDIASNLLTIDYSWYAFPFQLCTTPLYVSLICLILKNGKIRESLLSYVAFITILGSIATIIMPDSCFVDMTVVNIHTMWLHCGSLVVSIYLLMTGEVKFNLKNFLEAVLVFLIFVFIAEFLNILVYNLNILDGETFNMFYISPYFISDLPIFNVVQENVSYTIYLIFYISAIIAGSIIIYNIGRLIKSCPLKKIKFKT